MLGCRDEEEEDVLVLVADEESSDGELEVPSGSVSALVPVGFWMDIEAVCGIGQLLQR